MAFRRCNCSANRGQGDAASGELFAGGICRQEEADAAGQVSGRNRAGRAMGATGGASATALPEGRARPVANRSGADAADPLPAAMVWAGRWCDGGGAMEDALYDSQALRGFAGIDLTVAAVPEETTILNFRHWLEQHELSQALFAEVSAMLEERGLLMRQGTIVDATIIAAPPSTKNKSKARDLKMHQTRKANQWHFGMKADIGVDVASGLVHTVTGTAANEADITQTAALLHGEEEAVFGDAGYTGSAK